MYYVILRKCFKVIMEDFGDFKLKCRFYCDIKIFLFKKNEVSVKVMLDIVLLSVIMVMCWILYYLYVFYVFIQEVFFDRFIECFIAEQNFVGVGIGCGIRGRIVLFIFIFVCFLSRVFDQIRMGVILQINVNFVGFYFGVFIGK